MPAGVKAILRINGGTAPNTGPEGLLCAIFGVAPKDIKYPILGLLPLRKEVDNLPMESTTLVFEEWLTGFWEGDGGIYPGGNIYLWQKLPQILVDVQEELEGGELHKPASSKMWYLAFGRSQGETLRGILSRNIVCPKRADQLRSYYPEIELHRPTKNWFVGFWDAEGYSYAGEYHLVIGISQKDKYVLKTVQNFWGFGGLYGCSWATSRDKNTPTVKDLLLAYSRNEAKKAKLIEDVKRTEQYGEFRSLLIIND